MIKFRGLNLPKDDIECESFTVISIGFLLVCNKKYYQQVHFDHCASETVNKQMRNYLDESLSEDYIL